MSSKQCRIDICDLKAILDSSILKKSPYRVDLDLMTVFDGLSLYSRSNPDVTELGADKSAWPSLGSQYLFECGFVPKFQRDNTKWTDEMKSGFIENLLRGARTDVVLYSAEQTKSGRANSRILDGLQRLSAICDFVSGKILAFGYSCQELQEALIVNWSTTFGLSIYNFKSHADAAVYYIQMNRGITHSPEDILRAVTYFEQNLAQECLSPQSYSLPMDSFRQHVVDIHGDSVVWEDCGCPVVNHVLARTTKVVESETFSVVVASYKAETSHEVTGWIASKSVSDYHIG